MKLQTIILILVLIACAAPACKKISGTETETDMATAKAKSKESVIAASKKLNSLPTLSAIVEGEGQLAIKKDVQYAAPDRYHIVFTDATGARTEMISVGDVTYIKNGEAWDKMPSDISPTSTFRNNFTDDVLPSITDTVFETEETVNGKPALVYSYKLVTKVGNFPVVQRIWVDKSSGIPIKAVAEYREGDSQEKRLTTTFDTDKPVTIELPVK
jgi:outer membrane lipoprotein-sorting protein